jgi:hypothetical protein
VFIIDSPEERHREVKAIDVSLPVMSWLPLAASTAERERIVMPPALRL